MKKIIRFSGLLIIVLLSGFCNLYAQKSAIVKGQITDALTGAPMEFVNVVEMDKNGRFVSGTMSDLNGNYIIKVTNDQNPLQVSFIGYNKQNVDIKGRTQINIKLQSDDQTLGEVRIEGQKMGNDGFTKVRDRATSVARIDMKDMKSLMSTSVEDLLQGRLGNVDISSVSGDPGAGLNIRIRGTATLNARNTPLIVINGIPYDAQIDQSFDFASADVEKFGNLIDVSPEDIETIEVLKDASSTAAWGSKASNGVLMIKTKRGIKSKPIFEYTFKNTIAKEPDPIPMLDGPGYSRLIMEEYFNWNRGEFSRQPQFKEIAFDEARWASEPVNLYHNYAQQTDWVKEITQISHTKQHDFSIRGGGDKSRYNMSVGFFDETGTTINNGLKKLNLRSSLDYDLSSKLQFKSDIMFTRYDQYNTYDAEDWRFNNNLVRQMAYRRMPNLSVMFRDTTNQSYGEYFTPRETLQGNAGIGNYNPVAFATLGQNKQLKDNARALFTIKYNIKENLIYNSTVTLDIFDNKREKFLPFKAIGYDLNDELSNKATNDYSKKSSIYTINQLIYNPKLGEDHDLAFMGQFDTEETVQRTFLTETSRSASPEIQQPIGDVHLNYMRSNYYKYRSLGMYVNTSYKFKDKYIFSVGAKYEGNSKFSKKSRWGLFPTISAAWRINQENFLKDVTFINDLKLRASWGQSGNSPEGQYLYFNTYEAGSHLSYLDMQGVQPKNLELTSLMWETIDQINPGLSFFGLDNRLNIEIDYYQKRTLNLFLKDEDSRLPEHTGFESFSQNNGELENRGTEFMVDYAVVRKNDFELSFNLNLSNNKNVIIRLPDNFSDEYGNMLENGNYKISITPGEAMGGFFGYRFLGVYAQEYNPNAITPEEIEKNKLSPVVKDKDGNPIFGLNKDVPLKMIMGGTSGYEFEAGDAMYDDINHDGKIDELDLVYLGDLNPKLMGGFGNKIRYKGFIVNSFFYFKVGQKIINQTRMDTEKMYRYENQSKATNWRWRREGDITDMPKALYERGFNWLGSDRFVEDGSYLRLKTLSLSYVFNQGFVQKLRVKDLKVYATGYNLYTWTKYSGQDPDVAPPSKPDQLPKDYSRTPPSRKLLIGVNITF